MRVPDLEDMITEVYDELSAKEKAEEVMGLLESDNIKTARKILDVADKMNLLQINPSGHSSVRWIIDTKTHPEEGGSVTHVSNTNLRITHASNSIPPRLNAPLIPSTLGDKSSFKPGRHKKRAKS